MCACVCVRHRVLVLEQEQWMAFAHVLVSLLIVFTAGSGCKLSRIDLNELRRQAEELERHLHTCVVCVDDLTRNRSIHVVGDMVNRLWYCT